MANPPWPLAAHVQEFHKRAMRARAAAQSVGKIVDRRIDAATDRASRAYQDLGDNAVENITGVSKEQHYARNNNGPPPPRTEREAVKMGFEKMSPERSVFHKHNGEINNKKYISKDGKLEAVYDLNGAIVTNAANRGTNNIAHPDDWVPHAQKDVFPYVVWGNSPDDPVPWTRRLRGADLSRR